MVPERKRDVNFIGRDPWRQQCVAYSLIQQCVAYSLIQQCVEHSSRLKKDMMLMLGLNETKDQLAMANSSVGMVMF